MEWTIKDAMDVVSESLYETLERLSCHPLFRSFPEGLNIIEATAKYIKSPRGDESFKTIVQLKFGLESTHALLVALLSKFPSDWFISFDRGIAKLACYNGPRFTISVDDLTSNKPNFIWQFDGANLSYLLELEQLTDFDPKSALGQIALQTNWVISNDPEFIRKFWSNYLHELKEVLQDDRKTPQGLEYHKGELIIHPVLILLCSASYITGATVILSRIGPVCEFVDAVRNVLDSKRLTGWLKEFVEKHSKTIPEISRKRWSFSYVARKHAQDVSMLVDRLLERQELSKHIFKGTAELEVPFKDEWIKEVLRRRLGQQYIEFQGADQEDDLTMLTRAKAHAYFSFIGDEHALTHILASAMLNSPAWRVLKKDGLLHVINVFNDDTIGRYPFYEIEIHDQILESRADDAIELMNPPKLMAGIIADGEIDLEFYPFKVNAEVLKRALELGIDTEAIVRIRDTMVKEIVDIFRQHELPVRPCCGSLMAVLKDAESVKRAIDGIDLDRYKDSWMGLFALREQKIGNEEVYGLAISDAALLVMAVQKFTQRELEYLLIHEDTIAVNPTEWLPAAIKALIEGESLIEVAKQFKL